MPILGYEMLYFLSNFKLNFLILDFEGLLMQLNAIWHYNTQLTKLNHYYAFKFKLMLKYGNLCINICII